MSGLGDMGNLLKQAQEMQLQMDRVKNELRSSSVEGQAGGGAVRIELTSDRHEVKAVHLAEEVAQSSDSSLISDLVLAALQEALRRAEAAEKDAMGKVTGGMHLPGLF